MRIPSQFNRDSLYRRDNRHHESTNDYRRIIRLVIGLAIVVMLMRQASRPAVYQTFFDPSLATDSAALQDGNTPPNPSQLPAPPVTPDPSRRSTVPPLRVEDSTNGDPVVSQGSSAAAIAAEDRQTAAELIEGLLPSDQREWLVALSHWQSGRPIRMVPSTIESIRERLDSLDSISQPQRENWQQMLEGFTEAVRWTASVDADAPEAEPGAQQAASGSEESGSKGSPPPPDEAVSRRVAAMVAALDDAANARVVDGSVWRSGDFDSLYHFLDQSNQLPRSGVAAVGVLPLLQQPEVFRNQWVRFHGSVARSERIETQENPYGLPHYWQLWLRPSDGVNRPLVAIVPTVPDTVAVVGNQTSTTSGPEITVVGRYLKRLAYQSSVGADLAPVIVGQITSAPMSEREWQELEQRRQPQTSTPLGWPILLACLLGLGFAIFVMWHTAVSAKRARELRQSHRAGPDAFLQELGDQDPENDTPTENENP